MPNDINDLITFFLSKSFFPDNFRLFLFTPKRYLRIYGDLMSSGNYSDEFGFVTNLKFDRGDILKMFSKLEFFINELINLKIIGLNNEKSLMLDRILVNVDLFSRILLLVEFKIISSSLKENLMRLKEVRNGSAHFWDMKEVYYKRKPLKDNFSDFKKDVKQSWSELIKEYQKAIDCLDFSPIKAEIEKLN